MKKGTQKKKKRVLPILALLLAAVLCFVLWNQLVFLEGSYTPAEDTSKNFRVALSLSPFSLPQFEQGYSFQIGDQTAATPQELQAIYCALGATEMYARIATKRHVTEEDVTDGKPDTNANVHTFDQGIELCKIAAALDIPINPEIMCAYTYMDMETQQAPRFEEYPEIYALQNGKDWSELTLDEICTVLRAYGAFVGEEILKTGCRVENWNLGNEANFGFAGISLGLKTAVNPKLEKVPDFMRYILPTFAESWLEKNLWQYDAKAYAAVRAGILSAYDKLGVDASDVKFSTHIATVVATPGSCAAFFNCMKKNGYEMDVAGISYYPSAPSLYLNKEILFKKTVTTINKKCGLPVFIGEFSYPSGAMEGPFAGWNKKTGSYAKDAQGQADLYADVIAWGKTHGLAGIRYWAPDYEGWYAMSMFEFKDKVGTAKPILLQHEALLNRSYKAHRIAGETTVMAVLFVAAGLLSLLGLLHFLEKGRLLNCAYRRRRKETGSANQAPYFRQSAIVFWLLGAGAALLGAAVLFHAARLQVFAVLAFAAALVYRIVSSVQIDRRANE